MSLSTILQHPQLYQAFQSIGGFFSARLRATEEYLALKPGDHVIDVGCGPGFLARRLPPGVRYDGIDIDRPYIEYARRRFGSTASFHCRSFDESLAAELGPADVIMMNGPSASSRRWRGAEIAARRTQEPQAERRPVHPRWMFSTGPVSNCELVVAQ
jgi:SAM-dependent methyltransferase